MSFTVHSSTDADEQLARSSTNAKPYETSKKALLAVYASKALTSEVDGARTRNHRIDSPVL